MKINGKQVCPGCKKPIKSDHPKADVWHMACIMKSTEHLRKKVKKN